MSASSLRLAPPFRHPTRGTDTLVCAPRSTKQSGVRAQHRCAPSPQDHCVLVSATPRRRRHRKITTHIIKLNSQQEGKSLFTPTAQTKPFNFPNQTFQLSIVDCQLLQIFKTARVCDNNGSTLSFENTPQTPNPFVAASTAAKCAVSIITGKSGAVLCSTRAVSTPFITGIE